MGIGGVLTWLAPHGNAPGEAAAESPVVPHDPVASTAIIVTARGHVEGVAVVRPLRNVCTRAGDPHDVDTSGGIQMARGVAIAGGDNVIRLDHVVAGDAAR